MKNLAFHSAKCLLLVSESKTIFPPILMQGGFCGLNVPINASRVGELNGTKKSIMVRPYSLCS